MLVDDFLWLCEWFEFFDTWFGDSDRVDNFLGNQ